MKNISKFTEEEYISKLIEIFKVKFAPPFTFEKKSDEFLETVEIYNRLSRNIGYYHEDSINFYGDFENSLMKKIKKTFNINELSIEDTDNIAKHLVNWWQKNFSDNVKTCEIWNEYEGTYSTYYSD